jgi:hypothetical protein
VGRSNLGGDAQRDSPQGRGYSFVQLVVFIEPAVRW